MESAEKSVSKMELDSLTESIIGAAIEVHRELGPGLLESLYERALFLELQSRGISCEQQVYLPVHYKGQELPGNLRIDLLVAGMVIVEIKAVDALLPVHEAQLLSYLRLADLRVGLLMNFHALVLKQGLKRLVNRI